MKVRANQVGVFGGRRRMPGEEFEIPETFRLALWMDPVDPTVQRPPRKRPGILIGKPVGALRADMRNKLLAAPPATTLHAIAHGETLVLKTQLAAANTLIGDMTAKLEAAFARLATLEQRSAAPPATEDFVS